MDWKFFETVSETEAKKFLEDFLSVEAVGIKTLIESAHNDSVEADYSIDSIEPLFQWGLSKIGTIPQ